MQMLLITGTATLFDAQALAILNLTMELRAEENAYVDFEFTGMQV